MTPPLGYRVLRPREVPKVGDLVWSDYFGCWLLIEATEPNGSVRQGRWWFRRVKNGQPWGRVTPSQTYLAYFVRRGLIVRKGGA